MHFDLGQGAPDQLHADYAIVGAGAAGITIARRLLSGGRSVILLESGGLDYERRTADLNSGRNVGQDYYELDEARLRMFGGTTAIWGGRCAEFDAIDLEKRDWVPHSEWPFSFQDLQYWYEQARPLFDVEGFIPPSAPRDPFLGALADGELAVRYWTFDHRFERFTFDSCADLRAHPRCTIVTHATVREVVAFQSARGVQGLDVAGPGSQSLSVKAHAFVLAAGGIENPRILLASRSVVPVGLGNDHDLVGRFFMEHPHARGGRIVGASAWRILCALRERRDQGIPFAPLLTPSPELQRRLGILNSAVTVAVRPPADGSFPLLTRAYLHAKHQLSPTKSGRNMWKLVRRLSRQFKRHCDPLPRWLSHTIRNNDLALVIRAEQAPNPDSRVMLGGEKDATGMPRVVLDWRLTRQDTESVAALVDALGREIGRIGAGRVERAEWLDSASKQWASDPTISVHPLGGYHHVGTTRMAISPRHGVTDGWGRVHGIDNLYVAGSSLFPTSGWANPTLSIVALGLRTADHLLSRGSANLSTDLASVEPIRQAKSSRA
jgi:choline dehydrogenase-like flavoprotein